MSYPIFSIIIPAKNEEKYLPGCLESIHNIDYPNDLVEVIVVDNGSNDRTCEIAKNCGAKVFADSTRNVSGLRNVGASHATGDILAFIDADCLASRDWLKNASAYADRDDVAAWGSPPVLPNDSTWVQRTWYLVRQKSEGVQDVEWLESMNLFVRKEQFQDAKGFNESLVTCEDVDFSYRLQRLGRIVSDDRIKVFHLGEAKTLAEFMNKEIWRGKSNLAGIRSHGFSIKELPSLSIPLYFGLFLPFFLAVAIWFWSPLLLVIFTLLFLMPGVAVLIKAMKKGHGRLSICRLFFLVNIYFLARTLAIVKRDQKW